MDINTAYAPGQFTPPTTAVATTAAKTSPQTDDSSATQSEIQQSTTVTLSQAAQNIAKANAAGITFSEVKLPTLDTSQFSSQTDQAKYYAQFVKENSATPPMNSKHQYDGATSIGAWDKALESLGASQHSAEAVFGLLDANGDGEVSTQELLSGLGKTASEPASAQSQALLQLMDTDANGSVSASEYTAVEMALVSSETPASNS